MNQNSAATNALREYSKINQPRYAFMIEAPWGAGKTHLVKQQFKEQLASDKARYVSLNGVSDKKALRRALLAGTSTAKLHEAAGQFGNAIGRMVKLGNVGSLVQDAVEDRMIDNLPDLLIFDDIERCELSPNEILGFINEFVEHQKKNVVVCAYIERNALDENSDEKKRRNDFLSRKEKVVGRTVRIEADANSALPEFINAMPDGPGKDWFLSNDQLVLDVFAEAKHHNLRVLRQCLQDCGRVINVLEKDILSSKTAMERFVYNYLMFSMALSTSRILPSHLAERAEDQVVSGPKEDQEPHPLYNLSKDFSRNEIYTGGNASILPIGLGLSLLGVGYAPASEINDELRVTQQFSGEPEAPLWIQLVKWRELPSANLERAFDEARSYIFESETIEAGPYLHIANDLLSLTSQGHECGIDLSSKIVERINLLARMNKIPAAAYGGDFGWNLEMNTFTYGGFGTDLYEEFKPVVAAMKDAQIAAFEASQPREAERLLELLQNHMEEFESEFSGIFQEFGYSQTAILHVIDSRQFAEAVFGHLMAGRGKLVGKLLSTLGSRHHPTTMHEELPWAEKVREILIELSDKAGPLEKARMDSFLRFNWKFPAEEKDERDSC